MDIRKHEKDNKKDRHEIISDEETIEKVVEDFARTTDEIISLKQFKALLSSGRQLKIKFGVDVTAPDLHIGHAVNLWMANRLQELGHKVIFLIGDFTTQIGDPTGKDETRPVLSSNEINKNTKKFMDQAKMILGGNSELMEIRKNSEWYDDMSAEDLLSLMSKTTHNQLMNREMFKKRLKEGKLIYEHELIYPILQSYDSVVLESDLTIIGSDQLFNEMMARSFQEKFDQKPQVVITTKITPGIDGGKKQSKGLDNYIGLNHSPRKKFGRLMSIPDKLVTQYFKVYTSVPLEKIEEMEENLHPMKYKLALAEEIVKRYHGKEIAKKEREWFLKTFSKDKFPEDAPEVHLGKNQLNAFDIIRAYFPQDQKSNSNIKRLFKQGAIKFENKKIKDIKKTIKVPKEGLKVKVGKKDWFVVKP